MSKLCSTCRYWLDEHEAPQKWGHCYLVGSLCHPIDLDTGKRMKLPFEVKICTNPKLFFAERPVEEDGFAVVDGSEYYAALVTAENFGCVLHSEKEEL